SSRGLLACALIIVVSVVVLWYLQAPEKTFIGRGLPYEPGQDAVSGQLAQQFPVNPGEHSVLGAPSISAAAIDSILAEYGSPAAGTGHVWIALGQHYGIDPAYAVAFFIHESSAGTNPGWAGIKSDGSTTHNVGNIICAGYATCYGRFRDYPSWDEGIGDWYKLISQEYVNGRRAASVEQIIPIYAPSFENDVDGYIRSVVTLVDGWRQQGVAQ
ncbi:MAG TPA: glucosaminidase domain-containing protein, partial [Roseiflexaceae bacterium]|nr:glucosaminidase domain-containing protein [Roseiflexaceae bacterium]